MEFENSYLLKQREPIQIDFLNLKSSEFNLYINDQSIPIKDEEIRI
jgi:hypothetical protein